MCLWRGVLILVGLATVSETVKVNMMGSLSLGSEVLDVLADYVKENIVDLQSGRRMMPDTELEAAVSDAKLCRENVFCSGNLEKIVNDYVIDLSRAISEVFEGTLQGETFNAEAKKYLRDVKKILKQASSKVTEEIAIHMWTEVFKKISSSLLERATEFLVERLDTNEPKTEAVVKLLTQHLVLAVTRVEYDHQTKLCSSQNICVTKLECSKTLNYVLDGIRKVNDDQARDFMKAFHQYVTDSAIFLRLESRTRLRIEQIFKDMYSDSDTTSLRDILKSVKNVVHDRIAGKAASGNDVLLMHVIMSDLDHVYDHKKYPFEHFLRKYDNWVAARKTTDNLRRGLKQVIEDISSRLAEQSTELIFKLMSEARVFLEITIDDPVPAR